MLDNCFCKSVKESQGKETWHDQKEINVSLDRKSLWRLRIFADYFNEKQGLLSVGDVIWINLSEEDVKYFFFAGA